MFCRSGKTYAEPDKPFHKIKRLAGAKLYSPCESNVTTAKLKDNTRTNAPAGSGTAYLAQPARIGGHTAC